MAVHIRLARGGTKKTPIYRVVVTDQRSPRGGRFLENIGTFDPSNKDNLIKVDEARFNYWRGVGAQPSDTVDRLVVRALKASAAAAPKK
jgi:small subunit ribosomal protein S16